MNKQAIKFNWPNILEMGQAIGFPLDKKRALIREYLQCHFLSLIYKEKKAKDLSFIGGTSLRLLHNLDRFSEDLDFDNLGLSSQELSDLFQTAVDKLKRIGIENEFKFKKVKPGIWRGYLRFKNVLKEIGLSAFEQEKLMIKIEVMKPKIKIKAQIIILNRFGVLENIVTNDLPVILAQKSLALLHRRPAKARDFYDVVWLLSRRVEPVWRILKKDNIKSRDDYKRAVLNRYEQIKPDLKYLKKQLQPFLIDEDKIKYLDLFPGIIQGS